MPTKALKTGARATPHTVPQPLPVVDIETEATKLREAVARGTLESQLARAQEGGGDTGQGEAAVAARADFERETGRGGTESAAQPSVGAGGGGADSTA